MLFHLMSFDTLVKKKNGIPSLKRYIDSIIYQASSHKNFY